MNVHLLGIRHHGPGSARSVLRALEDLHPDVVLVEAPADVDTALRWVGEAGLVPPVALLTVVIVVVAVIFPIVFYPLSKSLWSGIDLAMRKPDPDDDIDPRYLPPTGRGEG